MTALEKLGLIVLIYDLSLHAAAGPVTPGVPRALMDRKQPMPFGALRPTCQLCPIPATNPTSCDDNGAWIGLSDPRAGLFSILAAHQCIGFRGPLVPRYPVLLTPFIDCQPERSIHDHREAPLAL